MGGFYLKRMGAILARFRRPKGAPAGMRMSPGSPSAAAESLPDLREQAQEMLQGLRKQAAAAPQDLLDQVTNARSRLPDQRTVPKPMLDMVAGEDSISRRMVEERAAPVTKQVGNALHDTGYGAANTTGPGATEPIAATKQRPIELSELLDKLAQPGMEPRAQVERRSESVLRREEDEVQKPNRMGTGLSPPSRKPTDMTNKGSSTSPTSSSTSDAVGDTLGADRTLTLSDRRHFSGGMFGEAGRVNSGSMAGEDDLLRRTLEGAFNSSPERMSSPPPESMQGPQHRPSMDSASSKASAGEELTESATRGRPQHRPEGGDRGGRPTGPRAPTVTRSEPVVERSRSPHRGSGSR
jgi:hypothetical protein